MQSTHWVPFGIGSRTRPLVVGEAIFILYSLKAFRIEKRRKTSQHVLKSAFLLESTSNLTNVQAYRATCPSSPQGFSLKYSSDIVILEKKRGKQSWLFTSDCVRLLWSVTDSSSARIYCISCPVSARHTIIVTDWFFQIQSCMLLHTYVIYTNLCANHIYRSLHEYMYCIIMRVHNDNHKI